MPKAKMSKKPKKAAAPSKIAHRPSIPLTSLATELICAIFSLLSIADIGTLREVCARFRSIIKENLNDRLEGLIGPEHVILVPFRKGLTFPAIYHSLNRDAYRSLPPASEVTIANMTEPWASSSDIYYVNYQIPHRVTRITKTHAHLRPVSFKHISTATGALKDPKLPPAAHSKCGSAVHVEVHAMAENTRSVFEARKTFEVGKDFQDGGEVIVPRVCKGKRGGEPYWLVYQMNGRKVTGEKVCGMAHDNKFTITSWRIFKKP